MSNITRFVHPHGLLLTVETTDNTVRISSTYRGEHFVDDYELHGLDTIRCVRPNRTLMDFTDDNQLGLWALSKIADFLLTRGVRMIRPATLKGGIFFSKENGILSFGFETEDGEVYHLPQPIAA